MKSLLVLGILGASLLSCGVFFPDEEWCIDDVFSEVEVAEIESGFAEWQRATNNRIALAYRRGEDTAHSECRRSVIRTSDCDGRGGYHQKKVAIYNPITDEWVWQLKNIALCADRVKARPGPFDLGILTAHELGHTLDVRHTAVPGIMNGEYGMQTSCLNLADMQAYSAATGEPLHLLNPCRETEPMR